MYKEYDECKTIECKQLIYKYMWKQMETNINKTAQQFSRSGNVRLPREIWRLILLKNRQRQLCKELSSNKNKYLLILFADMLEIPTHPDITKKELCNLISIQLTWGGKYSEKSVHYFKTQEGKKQLLTAASTFGININQSIDKIIKEISEISFY